MDSVDRIADRTLGYLGLFLIGAISWVADHVGTASHPVPIAGARVAPRSKAPAGVPRPRPLATSQRTGG
jgi:hypothetical protein